MPKVVPIITHKVLLPVEMVDESLLKDHYEHHFFNEKSCDKCWVKQKGYERPYHSKSRSCYECPYSSYHGHFTSYSRVNVLNREWWALPSGNLPAIEENLDIDLSNADDRRCDRRVRRPITFTKKLFTGKELRNGKPSPNQVKLVKQFWRSPGRTGIIMAAPRSGKSACAVYLATKFARKTVILVHEKLLLNQFYKTFKDFTNIEEVERRTGRKLILIAKNTKDLESDVDYLLVNYQKFITDLGVKRVAKYLLKRRSLLICDECFPANTQISTNKGYIPIEKIKKGDYVYSYNHKTRTVELQEVVRKSISKKRHKLLRINHENGSLTCSEDHPIWSKTRNKYIEARNLLPGEECLFTSL